MSRFFQKFREKKIEEFLLILGIVIFTIAAVSLCFNLNIWTDEAFTMQLIKENFIDIIKGTAADVHPPLYYLIAKVFQIVFGNSLLTQKINAIIPVVITMIVGAHTCKKYFGTKAAVIFVSVLGSLPHILRYAIQVRMYSYGLLFVTICAIYAYENSQEDKRKNWLIMSIAGLAAAYTHYFALVSVAFIYIILLAYIIIKERKKILCWILMAVVTIVLYIPWLIVWFNQMRNVSASYWIPEITLETFRNYFTFIFQTKLPYFSIMYTVFLGFGLIFLLIDKKSKKNIVVVCCCILIPVLTILFGTLVSELFRPIYYDRYIFPTIAVFVFAIAISLKNIEKTVFYLICVFCFFLGVSSYREIFNEEYLTTMVPETISFMDENLGENDVIMYNFEVYGFIYEFYWPEDKLVYVEDMDFSINYDTIWYFETYNYTYLPEENLSSNNWVKQDMGEYGIEQNVFEIYKITKSE